MTGVFSNYSLYICNLSNRGAFEMYLSDPFIRERNEPRAIREVSADDEIFSQSLHKQINKKNESI